MRAAPFMAANFEFSIQLFSWNIFFIIFLEKRRSEVKCFLKHLRAIATRGDSFYDSILSLFSANAGSMSIKYLKNWSNFKNEVILFLATHEWVGRDETGFCLFGDTKLQSNIWLVNESGSACRQKFVPLVFPAASHPVDISRASNLEAATTKISRLLI